ncbi:UvrD-helicase domain-containing protein [Micromonospora sp. CPM1]|uniref:UvrD-helicase domain-containing protein n=1 Tax=Micromonospora sp. CPM1 TaxID=2944809 RepID=UPI002112D7EE|nr:UvrD-helicase domain-containing protein [Micromonospora sp. CPM1]
MLADADFSAQGFGHVMVDEAQDLHPAQWRVLRAAVPPRPRQPLITGDPHQRIYESRVSLGSLGISVTGRSSRLRVNYRSTDEILTWATQVLVDARGDELGGDGKDSLAGYRSLLHVRKPEAHGYVSPQAEVAALVEQVQHDNDLLREQCRLFVAATRAGGAVRVVARRAKPVPGVRRQRPTPIGEA